MGLGENTELGKRKKHFEGDMKRSYKHPRLGVEGGEDQSCLTVHWGLNKKGFLLF